MFPNVFFKNLEASMKRLRSAARAAKFIRNNYEQQFKRVAEDLSRVGVEVSSRLQESFDLLERLDKAGLTPNLGRDRSLRKLKLYKKLLNYGYAIFWIPRSEIVEKLVNARSEAERQQIIKNNKEAILVDCYEILNTVKASELEDAKLHLLSAIDSIGQDNHRAAQSAATVCIDAQLDQIIDPSTIRKYSDIRPKIGSHVVKLKSINDVPVQLIFAALQAPLLTYILRGFDRLNPRTVRIKYDRDSSTHSVSKRQYHEFNAILSIMTATSLLITTEKLGKGWLTDTADYI